MHKPGLTLDDLVRETGFTKRQIRFYISKRLVPGAGDKRGPYTVYQPETLERLQAIKLLKNIKIEPTRRAMTLDEIGHSLDTLSPDGLDALLSGRAELTIMDTEAERQPSMDVLEEEPPVMEPDGLAVREMPPGLRRRRSVISPRPSCADDPESGVTAPSPQTELARTLAQARDLVEQLTAERHRLSGLIDDLARRLQREDSP
ncbi:MAG: MerR family transcriptional regulator [bacterium]|nr:MerR family transcriptional regulator [bacterium]